MVYGTQITIVTGAYKPTNITGGPHTVAANIWSLVKPRRFACAPKRIWRDNYWNLQTTVRVVNKPSNQT